MGKNGSLDMLDGKLNGTLSPIGNLSGNLTVPKGTTPKKRIDYSNDEDIFNRPKIEGTELIGDKTFAELGLSPVTEQEIDKIIFGG